MLKLMKMIDVPNRLGRRGTEPRTPDEKALWPRSPESLGSNTQTPARQAHPEARRRHVELGGPDRDRRSVYVAPTRWRWRVGVCARRCACCGDHAVPMLSECCPGRSRRWRKAGTERVFSRAVSSSPRRGRWRCRGSRPGGRVCDKCDNACLAAHAQGLVFRRIRSSIPS